MFRNQLDAAVKSGFSRDLEETPLSSPFYCGGNVQRLAIVNPLFNFLQPSCAAQPNEFCCLVVHSAGGIGLAHR